MKLSPYRLGLVTVVGLLLSAIVSTSCQHDMKVAGIGNADSVNWKDSALQNHHMVIDYYNNNVHDSLVLIAEKNLKLCREHGLWHQYYETWTKLAEEYTCVGRPDSALAEAKEMHEEAMSQGDDYGIAGADFIKALVYNTQGNHPECARLLRAVLDKLNDMDEPRFMNRVYAHYMVELRELEDYPTMELTLREWRQKLDSLVKYNTDTFKIKKRNLMSFMYMYQRSSYNYYYIVKKYREASKAVDSIAYYNQLIGWTDVARNEVLIDRIRLAGAQGNYAEGLRLSDEQMSRLAQEGGYNNSYLDALNQRQSILAGMGRWKEAYEELVKCSNIEDSIRTKSTTDQLNELNKRFELDEVKYQSEREKMLAERKQLYLVLAIILLAALGGGFYGYSRYRSARRIAKMKAAQDRIEGELKIARDIQMSMVPSTFPQQKGLDMYASMTPAKEVGGDLYGYLINGSWLYFAVGDVSGKGVPASLFMAQVTRLFHTMANQGMEPVAICNSMNTELSGEDNVNGMFVTLFIGRFNMQTGHLIFCNAGHNPPVIGGGENKGDFLDMIPNAPIGLWPDMEYVGEEMHSMKGRALFIYTDGLTEAENLEQNQFGDEHLLDILRDTHFDTARQVVEALKSEVEKHRNGAEPNDDLTMLCLKVN